MIDKPETRGRLGAVAVGGVIGAATRWAVLVATTGHRLFPWPLLLVNVAGALLLGAVLAAEPRESRVRMLLHDGVAVGFCGGLTTFSTFTVELVDLIDDHHVAVAAGYGAVSVIAALLAVVIGAALLRRPGAAGAPVEGAP